MEMCKNSISNRISGFLHEHIKAIEKEKDSLFKEHYTENVKESMDAQEFFREYINFIYNYLDNLKAETDNSDSCPFVIINSIVEVQDMEDMETYQYRIVLPYSEEKDISIDCASCLSPLGKALLLKSIGQQVNVQIPTGTLSYVIKKITVTEQAIPECNKTYNHKGNTWQPNISLTM